MTIVCAYRDPETGETWMGADSLVTSGGFIFPEAARKIIRLSNGGLAGVAGPSRAREMFLRECLDAVSADQIRDKMFAAIKADGWKPDEAKGISPSYGLSMIVATLDGLRTIAGCGTIGTPAWGFAAIGSGEDIAYGAAWALNVMSRPGQDVVLWACRAACEFRGDCGGEIVLERL